jgi:hypothetical protein
VIWRPNGSAVMARDPTMRTRSLRFHVKFLQAVRARRSADARAVLRAWEGWNPTAARYGLQRLIETDPAAAARVGVALPPYGERAETPEQVAAWKAWLVAPRDPAKRPAFHVPRGVRCARCNGTRYQHGKGGWTCPHFERAPDADAA